MTETGGDRPLHGRNERTPAEVAFHALIQIANLRERVMQSYFRRFGISGSQWGILRALYRAENEGLVGVRMMDLGDRLLVRPPSVTGLVDRLRLQGYVSRNATSQDLRGKEVRLTVLGRTLVERVLKNHDSHIAFLMGSLEETEQQQLYHLLNKLGGHLQSILEGQGEGRVA
jgi:DNA-binding MarR family transcriptional regulator